MMTRGWYIPWFALIICITFSTWALLNYQVTGPLMPWAELVICWTLFALLLAQTSLTKRYRKKIELQDKQLAKLQSANKDLIQFAYIASHDLQEPLRTIRNYSMLLQQEHSTKLNEEGNRFVNTIIATTTRMENLIKAVLEYSRLGSTMNADKINTMEVLKEIEVDLETLIKESNCQLSYSDLPEIAGDQILFKQLLSNLIINAIRYRKKEVPPQVKITGKSKGPDYLIEIRDNGIGISPEHHEEIFELFTKLDSHNRGTGIGLSICKRIAELHQGRMEVESEPQSGSTFRIVLPKTPQ